MITSQDFFYLSVCENELKVKRTQHKYGFNYAEKEWMGCIY